MTPLQNRARNHISSLTFATAIFISSLGIFIAWKARAFEISPQKLIIAFLNNLYLPHVNLCSVGEVSGENILHIFYQFLLIALAMAVFIFIPVQTFTKTGKIFRPPDAYRAVDIHIQSYPDNRTPAEQAAERFVMEFRHFNGKTIPEKKAFIRQSLQTYRRLAQGPDRRHNAVFTDRFSKDPWMTYQRMLAYHYSPPFSFGIA